VDGIVTYNGEKVVVDASVTKVTTFASKGGGLTVSVETSDDPQTAAALIKNRGKVARITFEFSAHSAHEDRDEKHEQHQGQLALDDLDANVED